jgi:hypothetical protein
VFDAEAVIEPDAKSLLESILAMFIRAN